MPAGIVALTSRSAWLSATGTRWSRVAALPRPAHPRDAGAWELHPSGRVLLSTRVVRVARRRWARELVRTPDGRHYEALGPVFARHRDDRPTAVAMGHTAIGWIAALDDGRGSEVYVSPDGRRFARVGMPGAFRGGTVHAVTNLPDRLVLVGSVPAPSPNKPAFRATAWVRPLPR